RLGRAEQVRRRAAVLEGLLAAGHRSRLSVEVVRVRMPGHELLGVERVRAGQPAGQTERDMLVVADRDHGGPRGGDPPYVQPGAVELELVQLLGCRVSELGTVEED